MFNFSYTEKKQNSTKNKVRKCHKIDKFKHLESKLLGISYLSIKLWQFGTLKDTAMCLKLAWEKDNL